VTATDGESRIDVASTAATVKCDGKSPAVLMLLNKKSNSKRKKAKKRKAVVKACDKAAMQSVPSLQSPSRHQSAIFAKAIVTSPIPQSCLVEGYQSFLSIIGKKQLKALRDLCFQSSLDLEYGFGERPRAALLQCYESVEKVFRELANSSNTESALGLGQHVRGSGTATKDPPEVDIAQLRRDCYPSLRAAAVAKDDEVVKSFIDCGGLLAIRVLLGPEIGLISSIQSLDSLNHTVPVRLDGKREIEDEIEDEDERNSFWTVTMVALEKCCSTSRRRDRDQLLAVGLHVVLSDLLGVCQVAKEAARKARSTAPLSSSLLFDDFINNRSLDERVKAGVEEAASRSHYLDFERHTKKSRQDEHVTIIDVLLPCILSSLSGILVRDPTNSGGGIEERECWSHLVWYLFAANHLSNLVHGLRMAECSADGIISSGVTLVSSICKYLR
jgi:hypothetical protein